MTHSGKKDSDRGSRMQQEYLSRALATRNFAAFIVEPLEAEAGIKVPSREYLQSAQELFKKNGSWLVLDEVQTGRYRTGTFLAGHQFDLQSDMVVLAKALSGGLIPVSAVLMMDKVYNSVYSSLCRAIVHSSTFSENSMSMRAKLREALAPFIEFTALAKMMLQTMYEPFRKFIRRCLGKLSL